MLLVEEQSGDEHLQQLERLSESGDERRPSGSGYRFSIRKSNAEEEKDSGGFHTVFAALKKKSCQSAGIQSLTLISLGPNDTF